MRSNQNVKFVIGTNPADINGGGASLTAAVDTLGFNSCICLVHVGNIAADFTAMALTECDTSGGTYTAVSGADFAAALPLATGGDNTLRAIFLTLGTGRKRYLKLGYTPGAGATLFVCDFILFEGDAMPVTATQHGLTAQLIPSA